MTEENAAKAVEVTVPVENVSTETTTAPETVEATTTITPTDAGEAEQKGNRVQRRIDTLTREKYQARAETDALRRQLDELNKATPAPTLEAPKKPTLAAFDGDYEAFGVALTDYADNSAEFRAEQKLRGAQSQARDDAARRDTAATEQARQVKWQGNLQAAIESNGHEDFVQVALGGHWQPSPAMTEVIQDSDSGPELAYHLGSNPEEAERIAQMPPTQAARELGRIEATLAAPKQTEHTSNAPKPATPVDGSATPNDADWESDPNISQAEWARRRNKQAHFLR